MFGASEHRWCVPKNGRHLFTQPNPAPLIPKIATLVCPEVTEVTFSRTSHRAIQNKFVC